MKPISLLRMPYDGVDVPHVVIEVNQKCNISCRACYKDKGTYTKPLAQIQDEIDCALAQRNLRLVSLAGGEPSLHPQLPEVIEHARRRGVAVQMLSNGLALSDDQLRSYKAAGLETVFLHIDSLQRRPDARGVSTEAGLNPLRRELGARVTGHGLHCALSLTLYQENLDQLGDVVELVLSCPDYQRLLVTLCTDFGAIRDLLNPKLEPQGKGVQSELSGMRVSNAEVKQLLAQECGMTPFGYVASNQDSEAERWLLYYAFAMHEPGGRQEILHTTPGFGRVVDWLCRLSKRLGKSPPFGEALSGFETLLLSLAYGVAARDGRVVPFLWRRLRRGARLTPKSLVFQEGPTLGADGRVEFCKDCPDATVRDGKLVPVCMADVLSPKNARRLLETRLPLVTCG